MERVREIDNDDMRSFLEEVLRHERSLSGNGEYKQHYLDLIDERVVDDEE